MILLRCLPKASQIAQLISFHRQCKAEILYEFYKVLQEVEKYRKVKADIRNQAKAKVKEITKEQQEEILEQGRKEGKGDFLQKIANYSGTQGVNVT